MNARSKFQTLVDSGVAGWNFVLGNIHDVMPPISLKNDGGAKEKSCRTGRIPLQKSWANGPELISYF
jgi:hypothetical protein